MENEKKDKSLAGILSFFVPGLGQIYTAKTSRGIWIFLGSIVGTLFFVIPGIVVWIWGIFDAVKSAEEYNNKEIK